MHKRNDESKLGRDLGVLAKAVGRRDMLRWLAGASLLPIIGSGIGCATGEGSLSSDMGGAGGSGGAGGGGGGGGGSTSSCNTIPDETGGPDPGGRPDGPKPGH